MSLTSYRAAPPRDTRTVPVALYNCASGRMKAGFYDASFAGLAATDSPAA